MLSTDNSPQVIRPSYHRIFKWKGGASSCVRQTCSFDRSFRAKSDDWPRGTTCIGPDGTDYGRHVRSQEYPLGTVCSDKCKEHYIYNPMQDDWPIESTCVCEITGLIPFILHELLPRQDNVVVLR